MRHDDQVNMSDDKAAPVYEKDVHASASDTEMGRGDVEVHEETTHRGLKARHAQMIALGGTIGICPTQFSSANTD
jgi:amino acid transporter